MTMLDRFIFKFPKAQLLHQKHDRDCGVCVFAKLAGMSEAELLTDLPWAQLGEVSVDDWCRWLQEKGFSVSKREGCPDDGVSCAHLVAHQMNSERDAHWVYRDQEGDVHDPSPVSAYFPADDSRMRDLSFYSMKILTLSILRDSSRLSGTTF